MSTLYVTEPPTDGKVILYTPKGDIEIELWSKEAPKACKNFIALTLEGYFDNLLWHRIVPGFIIQTGDPTGTGQGGESFFGSPFENELHQRLRFNRRGLVAMANTGEKNSNDSQFFITLDSTPELQNKHTIFGRVAGSTIYNVLALANVEISESEPDRPIYPPKLNRAEVVHNPFPDLVPRITPEERKAQEQAKALAAERADALKRKINRPKKNVTLLSFGAEEDTPQENRSRKPMSSHDLLEDKRLSKDPHNVKRPRHERVAKESSSSNLPNDNEHPPEKRIALETVSQRPAAAEALLSAPEPKPKQSTGRDILKSIVRQYKQDKKVSKSARNLDTLGLLDSFRDKIKEKADVPTKLSEASESISSRGFWDEDEDMHEYGAEDDDDANWRSHRFVDDKLTPVEDYQVIDSRDTDGEMAMSLGFGNEKSRKLFEEKLRQDKLRKEGRRAMSDGSQEPLLVSPGHVFHIPKKCTRRVEDVEEEIFLLYTLRLSKDEDLGILEQRNDVVHLSFNLAHSTDDTKLLKIRKPREVSVDVFQNCTALRSRAGDTGSVVWRSSVYFAEHMLRQLWGYDHPSKTRLFQAGSLSGCKILELGAGTGVLPICLLSDPRWIISNDSPLQWISTDQGNNVPLIEKNLSHSVKKHPRIHTAACELDWLHIHNFGKDNTSQGYKADYVKQTLGSISSNKDTVEYPDVVISIDCVYNPALHAPLVSALDTFCEPRKTVILVVIQLRDVDNTRSFLEAWTEQVDHEIYHLEDELLPPNMQQGYAAWVAWRS